MQFLQSHWQAAALKSLADMMVRARAPVLSQFSEIQTQKYP